MDEFIRKIAQKLTITGKRLSVVRNPDGFLLKPDTQQAVLNGCGLLLLPITNSLELRVRYELYDKLSDESICYIMDNPEDILPDMKHILYNALSFSMSDLMPAYNETELRMACMTFGMASYLYNKKYTYDLSPQETREIVAQAAKYYGVDIIKLKKELQNIPLEWDSVETIDSISQILLQVISQDAYDKIESVLDELNKDFQKFVDSKYFTYPTSSHIKKPKTVNKILPYLAYKHERVDKVALVVIDGMSYWQYLILDKALSEKGLQTNKDITMAWLPSITKLSRQAIFRGDAPHTVYNQNPVQEGKIWREFWSTLSYSSKKMGAHEIDYSYNSLILADSNRCKQAFVDVTLDHKMHSSSDNKDLYDLTVNWSKEAAANIKLLHSQGYTIYITTDHGNVMAHPWRPLTSTEKTFLYEKDSRGDRYLIYKKESYKTDFLTNNPEIREKLLMHDNWMAWRDTKCFAGKNEITHGGSHFLEVIIPFITIEKN